MFMPQAIFFSLEPFVYIINNSTSEQVKEYLGTNDNSKYSIIISNRIIVNHKKQTIFALCTVIRDNSKKLAILRYRNKSCNVKIILDLSLMAKQWQKFFRTRDL